MNKRAIPQPKPKYFTKNNEKNIGNENIANGFNDFFTNVGPNLAEKIGQSDKHFKDFLGRSITNSIFLELRTKTEILNIVSNLSNKSSLDKDAISMILVKDIIDTVSEPMRHICNISISQEIFPEEMKAAKVVPLFKANDIKEYSNYRPVSILQQFSKILEKKINNRITKFIKGNDILAEEQYGFRDNCSTASA